MLWIMLSKTLGKKYYASGRENSTNKNSDVRRTEQNRLLFNNQGSLKISKQMDCRENQGLKFH